MVSKPPIVFNQLYTATKLILDRSLPSHLVEKSQLVVIPLTPGQLAERVEQTAEFHAFTRCLFQTDLHQHVTSELLRRSGYYHGVLSRVSEGKLWKQLQPYTKRRNAEINTLLLLDGCVFPQKQFEIMGIRIVRHSSREISKFGPPKDIANAFFPQEKLDPQLFSRLWFIRDSEKFGRDAGECTDLLTSLDENWPNDFALDKYWPQILGLALYHVAGFGIPIILISEPNWNLYQHRFAGPYYGDYDDAYIVNRSEFYKINRREWDKFKTFLQFYDQAMGVTKDWKVIQIAARHYLRAMFLSNEYGEAQTDDGYEEILLHYIIGLESLLLIGDREAIADKIALRAALIAGRNDMKRREFKKLLTHAYAARSNVVHGKVIKKPVRLLHVRDLYRRVFIMILEIYRMCKTQSEANKVIQEITFDQSLQKKLHGYRKDVLSIIK